LPAQIDINFAPGEEYNFLFMAKGGGSSNKTGLFQASKALLSEDKLEEFLHEKIAGLGVAACPPYHLAVVVGGTSPESNLKTLKLATAGALDHLPETGDCKGRPFRDVNWEKRVQKIAANLGLGAQFGGKWLALDSRVIRLPRHAGSCPVSIGVSCSAHRNILAKINSDGIFLEKVEKNPGKFSNRLSGIEKLGAEKIDLNKPMQHILEQLSKKKPGDLVFLNGAMIVARDIAHAKLQEILKNGKSLPAYFKDHPVYYAGPAKTPDGMAIGSFGPTTAQRMDGYVEEFMSRGGSMVMLAKGNRAKNVALACGKYGGSYLGTIGGAAALLARENIISSEVIAFPELGMEAIRKIEVKDLPAFIISNSSGETLY
jgi:fumarate hydratase class I